MSKNRAGVRAAHFQRDHELLDTSYRPVIDGTTSDDLEYAAPRAGGYFSSADGCGQGRQSVQQRA